MSLSVHSDRAEDFFSAYRSSRQRPAVGNKAVAAAFATGVVVALVFLALAKPAGAGEDPASRGTCPWSLAMPTGAGEGATATAVPVSAKSRATINDEWEIVTFVHLRAMGAARAARFRITELPQKGRLLDFRDNEWCRVPSLYVTETTHHLRHRLRYVPDRNEVGQDTFRFRVVDAQGRESTDAVATIEIERGGLRWYTTINGSSGLSDLTPDRTVPNLGDPEAIGKSTEDLMFHLDWQWKAPRNVAVFDGNSIDVARQPRDKRFRRRWSGHATVLAGYTQRPRATLKTTGDSDGNGRRNLTYGRAITVGADVHMGPVVDLDAHGTFAEFGPTLGAYFDAVLSGDGSTSSASEPPDGARSDYRFESGFRLAFKRMGSDAATGITRRRPVHPTDVAILEPVNAEDLFVFHFLYQRHQALVDLIPIGESGDSRNRLAFRFMATLPVPGGNENTRLVFGIEASQDIQNKGPRDVRMTYGVALAP